MLNVMLNTLYNVLSVKRCVLNTTHSKLSSTLKSILSCAVILIELFLKLVLILIQELIIMK